MKVYVLVTRFGAQAVFSTYEKAWEYFAANELSLVSEHNFIKVLEIDNPDYGESIKL